MVASLYKYDVFIMHETVKTINEGSVTVYYLYIAMQNIAILSLQLSSLWLERQDKQEEN
jgi:hypothetical protein